MERADDVGNDLEQEREETQADYGDSAPDDTVNAGQDEESNLEDEEPGLEDGAAG